MDLGRLTPAVGVHVVGHQLQAVQFRPIALQDVIEGLTPAERVRRHHRAALAMDLPAQVGNVNPPGRRERIGNPIDEEVPLACRDLDPRKDNQAGGLGTQFVQLLLGPEPVVFGDDQAVEPDLLGPAEHHLGVHAAVRRMPRRVQMQVEFHREGSSLQDGRRERFPLSLPILGVESLS